MQHTEKVYYSDAGLLTCTAIVLECRACDDKYEIVLDRTVFFPEGGGQASDLGKIDSIDVLDVQEKDEILYHVTKEPVPVGKSVSLYVDPVRRMDHCVQHTGEHMISGLAKSMYDAQNVGFHMADTYSTLDLDKYLTDDELTALEREVNAKLRENRRIYAEIVDCEGLAALTLRKKTDGLEKRAESFRIVYIDGVDSCTCCGSHCELTGEVGIVKFTSWQKYKSGIRIWFLCGDRAVRDYQEKQAIITSLAKRFSTSQDELTANVYKQGDENTRLKTTLKRKISELCALRAAELIGNADICRDIKLVTVCDEGADMYELKTLAEKLTEKGGVMAVLLSYSDGNVAYAVATSADVEPKANEICKTVNALLNGKGGGKPDFAQGSGKASNVSAYRESAEQLKAYICRLING